MDAYARLLVTASSLFLFPGCNPQAAAKESAESAMEDLKTSATTLNIMGAPRGGWSKADLNRNQAALEQCETSARRIEELNGTNGIVIYGAWALADLRVFLSQTRSAIMDMIAKKSRPKPELESCKDELMVPPRGTPTRRGSSPRFMVA